MEAQRSSASSKTPFQPDELSMHLKLILLAKKMLIPESGEKLEEKKKKNSPLTEQKDGDYILNQSTSCTPRIRIVPFGLFFLSVYQIPTTYEPCAV